MSRSKSNRSPSLIRIWVGRLGRLVEAIIPRSPGWVLATLALSGVALGGYQAWLHVVPWVADSDHFQVAPGDIVISQTPPWIRSDIKKKVLLDASLEGSMSILDEDLRERLWDAFAFHPWVKEVQQIELSAGPRIDVSLVYRRPVAVVKIEDKNASDAQYIPVDCDGRRLPHADLTQAERKEFPLIASLQGMPLEGETWSDPRAVGAARLAILLAQEWKALQLTEIRPEKSDYDPKAPPDQVLRKTKYILGRVRGRPILWGYAPELDLPGEPSDREKVTQLKYIVNLPESFGGPQAFDLRRFMATRRTARESSKIGPK